MEHYVISDTHFGHENIIGYCHRPFANADEMDEKMVTLWNEMVKPTDRVYHLGDVAMHKSSLQVVSRLNGHKLLVLGNHDIYDVSLYLDAGFKSVHGCLVRNGILFSHYPGHLLSVNRYNANVHGHMHDHTGLGRPYINVSMEVTDYRPVPLDFLIGIIERWSQEDELAKAQLTCSHKFVDSSCCLKCGWIP